MTKINPEYQQHLDILSGLPDLGMYEQQAEIGDRQARGELVQVNEVWYERVDLSPEAAAAVRRAVQAAEEARSHDDGPKHAVDGDSVWVAADVEGPLHVAASQAIAERWATENRGDYEGLSVTVLAVDRG